MDKCYKIYGYLARYKNSRSKFPANSLGYSANQVASTYSANQVVSGSEYTLSTPSNASLHFTPIQYNEILSLIQPEFTPNLWSFAKDNCSNTSISLMTGNSFCFSSVKPNSPAWIIDTGATNHMVHS